MLGSTSIKIIQPVGVGAELPAASSINRRQRQRSSDCPRVGPSDRAASNHRSLRVAAIASQSLRCSDACSATLPPIMRVGVSCAAVHARLFDIRCAIEYFRVHWGDLFWRRLRAPDIHFDGPQKYAACVQ